MSYRYRRTGSLPTAGPNVKRFLCGSYSALADGSTGNIAINVPIDAAAGRMIQIWSIEVELSAPLWTIAANHAHVEIDVARTAGTAARHVNDPDVIQKWHVHATQRTAVGEFVVNYVFDKDFYPAVPFMNNQIHITVTNGTGVSQTIYVKVWYTDLFVNMKQSIALLQSQVI